MLDLIDGGCWGFDDDSLPARARTFFAGTFNKNPLTMAVAKAVLTRLVQEGPALQAALTARTAALAAALNAWFEERGVPIRVEHFGSLFRFTGKGNLDLFHYRLAAAGVYVWEGRSCFLSTAHTDADLDRVIEAAKAAADAA